MLVPRVGSSVRFPGPINAACGWNRLPLRATSPQHRQGHYFFKQLAYVQIINDSPPHPPHTIFSFPFNWELSSLNLDIRLYLAMLLDCKKSTADPNTQHFPLPSIVLYKLVVKTLKTHTARSPPSVLTQGPVPINTAWVFLRPFKPISTPFSQSQKYQE